MPNMAGYTVRGLNIFKGRSLRINLIYFSREALYTHCITLAIDKQNALRRD